MSYISIDALQNMLSDTVFRHTDSSKKAAGRALGTIIEIISFYLLKTWGYEYDTAIEKPLPEYANPEITHNVEFTLHKSRKLGVIALDGGAVSSLKILNRAGLPPAYSKLRTNRNFIKDGIVKNACTFAATDDTFCNAYLSGGHDIVLYELDNHPYAMIECKRVGVEEGNKKGPQTIEKAKQGSYVARSVSSIQRVRKSDGGMAGILEKNGRIEFGENYYRFIDDAIKNKNIDVLDRYILTVGVVSNHGNWFTAENQNKEMKVLAQSYDWLLFLTDEGLGNFIRDTIIAPKIKYKPVQLAFQKSYAADKKNNRFTKTTMDLRAHAILSEYFAENIDNIESWFNVIAPRTGTIVKLKKILGELNAIKKEHA